MKNSRTVIKFINDIMDKYKCSIPFDHDSYHVVVDNGPDLLRVHVRTVSVVDKVMRHNRYKVNVRLKHRAERSNGYDVMAVYILPEKTWFCIPYYKIAGKTTISLYTELKEKYDQYREFMNFKIFEP